MNILQGLTIVIVVALVTYTSIEDLKQTDMSGTWENASPN